MGGNRGPEEWEMLPILVLHEIITNFANRVGIIALTSPLYTHDVPVHSFKISAVTKECRGGKEYGS
jgi:hypothetical protein